MASKLLDIYFSLFGGLLRPAEDEKRNSNDRFRGKDAKRSHGKMYKSQINDFENAQAEDLREKLTSAILTGINRAYPYTGSNGQRCVIKTLEVVPCLTISPVYLYVWRVFSKSHIRQTSTQAFKQ